MLKDLRVIYHYENPKTGDKLQRTFAISEIKRGEDDAHLKLIPNFEFVGMAWEPVVMKRQGAF
jgi:hypothetical protein